MATFQERVLVVIEALSKQEGKIVEAAESLDQMGVSMNKSGTAVDRSTGQFMSNTDAVAAFSQQYDGFFRIMTASVPVLRQINLAGVRLQTWGGRAGMVFRRATHGLKGFRMEMLGIMFFGMMMANAFKGMFRPVMEAFGVFELFSAMLLVVFLPVMEILFPIFLKLINFFMGLSDNAKLIIGVLAAVGVVFGTVLFILGSFALGIGSIMMLFGGLAVAVVSGIAIAVAAITGLAVLVFLVIKNWDKIKAFFSKIGKFIGNVFSNVGVKIRNAFVRSFNFIKSLFTRLGNWFLGWYEKIIPKSVRDFISGVVNIGKSAFGGGSKNDFIIRPGHSPVAINPNDTVVGFKGGVPGGLGGGTVINLNVVNNISVADKSMFRRELDEANARAVRDLRRLTRA